MSSLAARIGSLSRRFEAGELDDAAWRGALVALFAEPAVPGAWIHGTFDGHYELLGAPEETVAIRGLGGVLSGIARGAEPPQPQWEDLPWLADRLQDVRLATGPEETLPADLHDVRLHDVVVLHREDRQLRIRATLWGRVVLGPDDLATVRESVPTAVLERQVVTDQDGLVVYGPDTRAVEGTGHGVGSGASLGCAALGCVGLPTLVTMAVALWLMGGPVSVGLWIGVVGTAWQAHTRLPDARQVEGRAGCLGTVGVLAGAVLAVGALAWFIAVDPCRARPLWWLVPAALPVFAGLGVRWRATFVFAAAAWSYGLWLWSAVPEADCAVDPAAVVGRLPGVLAWQETWDHLVEATAYDPDADLLEQATQVGGDHRVSLDSALRDSEAWICGLPVHLSGGVLFEEESAVLLPDASPHLRRLGRLLRRVEGPIRLEGHGREAGLSGVRARTVTTWLEAHGGIGPDRLTPVGLGDTRPVVRDPDLDHYNHRIDVVRSCS